MRKLLGAFLALGMLLSGFMGVAAQDAPATSFAAGMDSPATWTDERGNPVATVAVNSINPEWDDYSEYSTPEEGSSFHAVTFTVTNISGASLIVEPYDFTLVDSSGMNNGRVYVSTSDEAEGTIFEDDLPLADGESAELTMVYQLKEGTTGSVFVWQPDSGVLIMVNFGEAGENGAIATGLNAPSTYVDESGNPIATLEVTGVDEDWQDFGEYDEPERGMVYRAISVKITNVSGASIIVEPYDFSMLDSTGMNNGRAWAETAEGSDVKVLSDDTPLGDGESFEGLLVFQMYPDIAPTAVLWQPDSGLLNMVVLDGSEGSSATPVAGDENATPETDDAVASPEAEEGTGSVTVADDDSTEADEADADEVADGIAASSTSDQTLVQSEPVVIHDVVDDEVGTVTVYSTQDNWEGYDEAANSPIEGTRFFLVTLDVEVTSTGDLPMSPLDFTVISDNGGSYQSDLYLNADDAEVKITDRGSQLPTGETTTIVIPFMVPEGETPVSIQWNTGADEIEISLVP